MSAFWVPSRMWDGQDAYIVGGGSSLRAFDWELLKDKNTIGCNSAFVLGAEFVKILIFADYYWWKNIGEAKLQEYGGIIVACCPALDEEAERRPGSVPSWVLRMKRESRKTGLGLDEETLGFNGNSGSLAINLALLLGAKRVFLLGFDMRLSDEGKANWHDLRHEKASAEVYPRFNAQLKYVARDVPVFFPGAEVINLTNDSALECFPKLPPEAHFGRPVTKG